jgi:hypothetical protein
MNNFGTVFLVLIFGDPLWGKGFEGALDWTSRPDWVISVCWGNDPYISKLWAEFRNFFFESIWQTLIKSRASRKNDITIKVGSDIEIAIMNRLLTQFVNSHGFITFNDKIWLK